jgi:hypothetical protein
MDDLLRAHNAYVVSDNPWQRRARLLQALWREANELPIGLHRGNPLGSRLEMPRAQEQLENYLTETIRACVRAEVLDTEPGHGKLYGRPRIFNDLLSSQPLCFNLFGELQADLPSATKLFRDLLPTVAEVTEIRFEHSPGRADDRFTGDRSAHDVFVEYTTANAKRGFVGIEVKYHEALGDPAAKLRPRYDEIADAMGVFRPDKREVLHKAPLQQIWRDHLLAGSLVLARPEHGHGFDEGHFAFLYPRENERCVSAVGRYLGCLAEASTFHAWTLEDVVDRLRGHVRAGWVEQVHERYLAVETIDALLTSR